jgi:hypothetical protein
LNDADLGGGCVSEERDEGNGLDSPLRWAPREGEDKLRLDTSAQESQRVSLTRCEKRLVLAAELAESDVSIQVVLDDESRVDGHDLGEFVLWRLIVSQRSSLLVEWRRYSHLQVLL